MEIRIVQTNDIKTIPSPSELGFGRHFADHMFKMEYSSEQGWHDPRIEPYGMLSVDPANLTLHYGQTIFEGMKAFRWHDGSIHLFRLEDHVERLARSAERLCMPAIDTDIVEQAIRKLVSVDADWVPNQRGTALYIRPTLVAMENILGVRPSKHYLLYIITSPVGSYYARGMEPTRILVEDQYSRAAMGGLGEAKTAANYAASLLAAEKARQQGFDQVLWLDASEKHYVEEVGTMNIFFVIGDTLVTPALGGTILDGITRRTVLTLATQWGMKVEERRITIDEVIESHGKGILREVFGSGTAAVIAPVGELHYQGKDYVIEQAPDSLRERFYKTITGIQYGEIPDGYGWTTEEILPARSESKSGNGKGNGNGNGNGNGHGHEHISGQNVSERK